MPDSRWELAVARLIDDFLVGLALRGAPGRLGVCLSPTVVFSGL